VGQTPFGMVILPWLMSLPDSWDGLLGAGEAVVEHREEHVRALGDHGGGGLLGEQDVVEVAVLTVLYWIEGSSPGTTDRNSLGGQVGLRPGARDPSAAGVRSMAASGQLEPVRSLISKSVSAVILNCGSERAGVW
jgi:hypothetical protein